MSLLQCKLRIKEWEKAFAEQHGRPPSKTDIKANAEIKSAYKLYQSLKKASQPEGTTDKDQAKAPKPVPNFVVDVALTDDESQPINPLNDAELGPTPQANGKVLSIFDTILSPPDSSPLKSRGVVLLSPSKNGLVLLSPSKNGLADSSVFKTPTKSARKIQVSDLTPAKGTSLIEKLRLLSSPAKQPREVSPHISHTPSYLGKVNNKFSFGSFEAGRASPTLHQAPEPPVTPTRNSASKNTEHLFQGSPSPLKIQRLLSFGNSRTMADIFNDIKSISTDELFEAQRLDFEKEIEESRPANDDTEQDSTTNQADLIRRKKATTQKRTTRRWKMKPKMQDEAASDVANVHDKLRDLESQKQQSYQSYINDEGSSQELTDDDDDELPVPRKSAPSTKINPVSNNYKRLKINDPRTKRFKQRMRRR